MSSETPATRALKQIGVAFTVHHYPYDPSADRIGLQAAEALGEPPERVLKTLMANVDGSPVCVVLPSDREIAMKKLAAAYGGKSASMMKPVDAERITGFKVGGISPFGQKRRVRTFIEQDALTQPFVYINAGQRGLQVRLAPAAAVEALNATTASLS